MINEKSLSELEGLKWTQEIPIEDNSSYSEYQFYKLFHTPLKDYSNSDIYFMIVENYGLKYFIDKAILILKKNVFVEIEDFPGDLLLSLINLDSEFWNKNIEKKEVLIQYINNQGSKLFDLDVIWEVKKRLKKEIIKFGGNSPY